MSSYRSISETAGSLYSHSPFKVLAQSSVMILAIGVLLLSVQGEVMSSIVAWLLCLLDDVDAYFILSMESSWKNDCGASSHKLEGFVLTCQFCVQ